MKGGFVNWLPTPASPLREAQRALRMLEAAGTGDPMLLGVTPVARLNPFQAQLYRSAFDHGVATTPITNPWTFADLVNLTDRVRVVVHFHWLSFVLQDATSPAEARSKLAEFTEHLNTFAAGGGHIVWTVHNLLPHDAIFPELEIELRNLVADRADIVHIMSQASLPLIRQSTNVADAKVLMVPHPNYRGCYPDHISRQEARMSLGIEPDELVFVMLGALKPYKGLNHLLDALDHCQRGTSQRVRLVIAGKPDDHRTTQDFVAKCLNHPAVLVSPARVAPEHVQYYMRAADVGLAPYSGSLNSGAAMLYSTFGLPSLVEDTPPLREMLAEGSFVACDTHSAEGLCQGMIAAFRLASDQVRSHVASEVSRFQASAVSNAFFSAVRNRLLTADAIPDGL